METTLVGVKHDLKTELAPADTHMHVYAREREVDQRKLTPGQLDVFRCLIRSGAWRGTATQLQGALCRAAVDCCERESWPTESRHFGRWLRSLTLALRSEGIVLEFTKAPDRNRSRLVNIAKAPVQAELATEQASAEPPLKLHEDLPVPSRSALLALAYVRCERLVDVWREGTTVCARGLRSAFEKVVALAPFAEELLAALPEESPPRRLPMVSLCCWRFVGSGQGRTDIVEY